MRFQKDGEQGLQGACAGPEREGAGRFRAWGKKRKESGGRDVPEHGDLQRRSSGGKRAGVLLSGHPVQQQQRTDRRV